MIHSEKNTDHWREQLRGNPCPELRDLRSDTNGLDVSPDQGSVSTSVAFREFLGSYNVKIHYGAVGEHGGIAVTERTSCYPPISTTVTWIIRVFQW